MALEFPIFRYEEDNISDLLTPKQPQSAESREDHENEVDWSSSAWMECHMADGEEACYL